MGSDSGEPTRRKHHRSSSGEDAESGSKRRKHRHRHHRHRSDGERGEGTTVSTNELEVEKVDEIEAGGRKLEKIGDDDGGPLGKVLVTGGSGFQGTDYEMEEGEIVEDDGLVDLNQDLEKDLHSDVESGEIGTTRNDRSDMGVVEADIGVHKKLMKVGKGSVDGKESVEVGPDKIVNSNGLVNGYCQKQSHKNDNNFCEDGKRTGEFVDGVKQQSVRKSSSLEKRLRPVSPNQSHDKYTKETSYSSFSKSPEWSEGRSRSQSIALETSVEDSYHLDGKQQSEFDDGRVGSHFKICKEGSNDGEMEKERKHYSSRCFDTGERHHNRDNHAYREGSRDRARERERKSDEMVRERERIKHRYRNSREREMLKDTGRHRDRERERYGDRERDRRMDREREREKERDLVKDRVREGRIKDVDRSREGPRDRRRDRSIDEYTLDERDRLSKHKKYDKDVDGNRYGDNESLHRRNSEYHKQKRSRSYLEGFTSKSKEKELGNDNIGREGNLQEDYQEEIAVPLEEQEEDDLEKIKEESRRRRQAILEKHKNRQQQNEAQPEDMDKEQVGESFTQVSNSEVIQEKHENRLEGKVVSAPESSISGVRLPLQNGVAAIPVSTRTGGLGEGTPKSERSDDMFCDDIFGESPAEVRKPGKGDGLAIEKNGLHDNWDDPEGYYGHRFGEILDGRYEIIAAQGKGVFSTVVRVKDLKAKSCDPDEVAIKIIRNNETMYKAGMEELVILKKLVGADPEDRRHCVRFLSTFKYRNHLCLVFESLHMNLREVLKKFGRNIGLKLTAVRTYAKQLFIALKHLKNCGVLHCDIKPDNMLVNESKNVLKLCDFGSAMFAGKNEITPYLVSRFYRAPEIILGFPYDHPLDIWSVGCCLFELYSGKVLFPGATNNDMIRLHMELKGPFPKKMLRKAAFTDQHFDQDLNFLAAEEDPVSKKAIRRLIVNTKPKDFGTLISASPGEDPKMVAHFKDLMEKIFVLDPDKRLNVSQALNHPFITGK